MLAGWGRVDHLLSAFQAELIACLHGVQAACNLGIGNLILETDATMVKQALTTDDFAKSMSGGLIDELKSLVSSNFKNFECVSRSRVCNRAAHGLATFGVGSVEGEEHITCTSPNNVLVTEKVYLIPHL